MGKDNNLRITYESPTNHLCLIRDRIGHAHGSKLSIGCYAIGGAKPYRPSLGLHDGAERLRGADWW